MDVFADLLERLALTPQRNGKLALMVQYFADTPDPQRGWALAALANELNIPGVKAAAIRALVESRVDPVLFRLSYDYVGDLAETVSLIWPANHGANHVPDFGDIVPTLLSAPRSKAIHHVEGWLDALQPSARWALIKLVTGGLRIGVSARLTKQALALLGHVDINEIEEIWHGLEAPYESLFAWLTAGAPKPAPSIIAPFRPVMLAHPLIPKSKRNDPIGVGEELITPEMFAAEWKYDGVRVQAVREGDATRLYTRTGDDIGHTFPDIREAITLDGAIDGELLVRRADGRIAPFNDLQQRLNRKRVTAKHLTDHPAFIRVYDILIDGSEDLRTRPFVERRKRLEAYMQRQTSDRLDLSPLIPVSDFQGLSRLRNAPPTDDIEGLMLKRWDSPYLAGRPTGYWYKWKRDPHLIDAVLLYAQRGHGRRSGMFSDFTFGVWRDGEDGPELTPVGKAYFGFTDDELKLLDAYVREHTVDRYGPVTAVEANQNNGLVFEVAFEGLQRSKRHKSGLAMRFPRIHRIRWDKPAREADTLSSLEQLLPIE